MGEITMKNIVICGDSYYDYDDRYPGLHWTDRLNPHAVYRLARGGASNFSIWHQIRYSIKFKPDVVFITFTSCPRNEFRKRDEFKSIDTDSEYLEDKMWAYRNNMWKSVDHFLPTYNKEMFVKWMPYYIEEYEILKNYLFIKSALDFLKEQKIKFYFTFGGFLDSFGGFLDSLDCSPSVIGIDINFDEYKEHNILPNGWYHQERLADPYFHIKDETWHATHAELIKSLL
jgi:hypothetical protein